MSSSELDSDSDNLDSQGKAKARRRVDAYHEALRERAAMMELEQPFIETRSWPPRRY